MDWFFRCGNIRDYVFQLYNGLIRYLMKPLSHIIWIIRSVGLINGRNLLLEIKKKRKSWNFISCMGHVFGNPFLGSLSFNFYFFSTKFDWTNFPMMTLSHFSQFIKISRAYALWYCSWYVAWYVPVVYVNTHWRKSTSWIQIDNLQNFSFLQIVWWVLKISFQTS